MSKDTRKPEYDCPVCHAKAGEWCRKLGGGAGWQHEARPQSSWEKKA